MWQGPALFTAVSIFLWRYAGAVFVPEALARWIFSILPVLTDMETVTVVNAAVLYFGGYVVFALFWPVLKPRFGNPFLASLVLFMGNVVIIFPILGRGILGYRFPQGWMAACFPLLVSHWVFARGLQQQDRRS
jgi:hypothetical protein